MRKFVGSPFKRVHWPSRVLGSLLSVAAAVGGTALFSAPAGAVTFDLSTLNVTATTGGRGAHFPVCPCVDPVSLTTIFNANNSQLTGWSEGTGSGAATLYFMGGSFGNNSGKIYLPSGGPLFSLPGTGGVPALSGSETTLGSQNTLGTGFYAAGFGSFPLYFWFGSPSTLNSLYISTSANLTILGLNGHGGSVIDTQTVTGQSGIQQVVMNWSGVTEVDIVGAASGSCFDGYACSANFYVNDIQVNDPVAAVPELSTWAMMILGFAGVSVLTYRRKNNFLQFA